MNYNHKEIYRLMRNFHSLGDIEVRIMDYLMKTGFATTTYSGLTEAIGMNKQKNASNVRKAILRLQEIGLVCITVKYIPGKEKKNTNPMEACFIPDNWLEVLLNMNL